MKVCFKNLNLIDGTGADLQTGKNLVVENGVITAIDTSVPADCDEVKDLNGLTVIPGMMDCHIHTSMGLCRTGKENVMVALQGGTELDFAANTLINLRLLAQEGVTYVRDAGTIGNLIPDLTLKKYVEEGWFVGSHVCSSGKIITMTGGHGGASGAYIADGELECAKAVREMVRLGVDCIKIVATGGVGTEGTDINAYQYEVDELQAIVREAHKLGRKVMVHAHGPQGIKNALIAGVDSIEHCTLVDDEGIEMMVKNGTYMTATFMIQNWIMSRPNGITDSMIQKEMIISERHKANFRKCYEAGVRIACGTDGSPTFMPHGTAKEVQYMVENSGMSNMEGILCATRNSADLMGVLNRYGTLEAGKVADFVVLNENPLEDITTLQRPAAVYMAGRLI